MPDPGDVVGVEARGLEDRRRPVQADEVLDAAFELGHDAAFVVWFGVQEAFVAGGVKAEVLVVVEFQQAARVGLFAEEAGEVELVRVCEVLVFVALQGCGEHVSQLACGA